MASSEVVSRYRRRKFFEKVNKNYFAPRGLKASIVTDKHLSSIINFPSDRDPLAPVDTASTNGISLRDRRMAALAPFISELSADVPKPVFPKQLFDKLNAKQINARRTNHAKKHQKLVELQNKDNGGYANLAKYLVGNSSDDPSILSIETEIGEGGSQDRYRDGRVSRQMSR